MRNDLHACRIHIFTPLTQFVKQGDSIWLTCYSPVKKNSKPLTRIMKLDQLVKQMILKKSSHTASYMYTIDN